MKREGGWGFLLRLLCPSRRFLQLLLTSSNSTREWNLYIQQSLIRHRDTSKTRELKKSPFTCCIAGRIAAVSRLPTPPEFWSASHKPYAAGDTHGNHSDRSRIHPPSTSHSAAIHSAYDSSLTRTPISSDSLVFVRLISLPYRKSHRASNPLKLLRLIAPTRMDPTQSLSSPSPCMYAQYLT